MEYEEEMIHLKMVWQLSKKLIIKKMLLVFVLGSYSGIASSGLECSSSLNSCDILSYQSESYLWSLSSHYRLLSEVVNVPENADGEIKSVPHTQNRFSLSGQLYSKVLRKQNFFFRISYGYEIYWLPTASTFENYKKNFSFSSFPFSPSTSARTHSFEMNGKWLYHAHHSFHLRHLYQRFNGGSDRFSRTPAGGTEHRNLGYLIRLIPRYRMSIDPIAIDFFSWYEKRLNRENILISYQTGNSIWFPQSFGLRVDSVMFDATKIEGWIFQSDATFNDPTLDYSRQGLLLGVYNESFTLNLTLTMGLFYDTYKEKKLTEDCLTQRATNCRRRDHQIWTQIDLDQIIAPNHHLALGLRFKENIESGDAVNDASQYSISLTYTYQPTSKNKDSFDRKFDLLRIEPKVRDIP